MFELFICLWSILLEWVLYWLTRLLTRLLNSWRQKSHEILVSYKFTVFVNYCNRYNVIVSVDLVHESAHHA